MLLRNVQVRRSISGEKVKKNHLDFNVDHTHHTHTHAHIRTHTCHMYS